jgi:hypothetical protein
MASFLPVHRWFPSVIGFSSSRTPGNFGQLPGHPLWHFDATLSVLPPCLLPIPLSDVDRRPERWAPRISSLTLQHIKMEAPFFSPPLSRERLDDHCPVTQKFRTQGLATLSTVFTPSSTREDLFQPPTLMGFAPRSFIPLKGSGFCFQKPSPLVRLKEKPLNLSSPLQRFAPL